MTDAWREAAPLPRLDEGSVHVWLVSLDEANAAGRPDEILSDDERARAARFHFDRDRHAFVVARTALRLLLGHYGSLPGEQIEFRYGAYGKPSLAHLPALEFNLSHSGTRALVAVAWGVPVGVDIEVVRSGPDLAEIADRFFSKREADVLRSLPERERTLAFYTCWTRKEAFIKAVGEGLSFPLADFEVSLHPGEPAALRAVQRDPQEASAWSLVNLEPGSGFVGALAARAMGLKLSRFVWLPRGGL